MKNKYFTVGPSQIYSTVPKSIKKALKDDVLSMSHRGGEFEKLYRGVTTNLRALLGIPKSSKIYFMSSATECMERVVLNTVERRSAHVVTGTFGKKFADIAVELGKDVSVHEVGVDETFESVDFESPEMIAFTQNDTSTGYRTPMERIYQVGETYPDALISLDVVSSLPYVDIDYSKIDMVLFSVQKGFGLPAGLAIMIVSPRAYKRGADMYKSETVSGSYHSFVNLEKYALKNQTFETPNVLDICLLQDVLRDMKRVGIDKIRLETEEKASLLYEFFKESEVFEVVVKEEEFQSITTPVVKVKKGSTRLLKALAKRGYIVGAGYGDNKKTQVRVANFPAQSVNDVKGLIKEMKSVL